MLKKMLHGRKSWKEIYNKDRNEHDEIDLQPHINLLTNCNIRNPMKKENLCLFVAARGSWPQFMVSEGGKEANALVMAFLYPFTITVQCSTKN